MVMVSAARIKDGAGVMEKPVFLGETSTVPLARKKTPAVVGEAWKESIECLFTCI